MLNVVAPRQSVGNDETLTSLIQIFVVQVAPTGAKPAQQQPAKKLPENPTVMGSPVLILFPPFAKLLSIIISLHSNVTKKLNKKTMKVCNSI